MGNTAAMSQIRSIPIFIVAAVVSLCVALLTDYLKHRYSFVMLGAFVGVIGYAILLATNHISVGVRYMACFLITAGGFIAQPVILAWLSNQVWFEYILK